MDALAQVVHRLEVLAPARVDDLKDDVALDLAHHLGREPLLALAVGVDGVLGELVDQRLAGKLDLVAQLFDRHIGAVERSHLRDEPVEIPVLRVLGLGELRDVRRDHVGDPALDLVGEIVAFEHTPALVVDDHALCVHHVVVLEDVLTRDEVLFLDLLLSVLDLAREDRRLHRLVVRDLEALHDPVDPVAGEEPDEVVLRGEVEAGLAGVALTARPPAQLVVDPARLVALGAEHVEPADLAHALAELDVDAASGHVRRYRHRARLARVLDDLALALVLLRVEDVVRDAPARQQLGEVLGGLDRDRADENRLALLGPLHQNLYNNTQIRFLRLEDVVVVVVAGDGDVRRDLDDMEVVDLDELLLLRLRRAGHAGELLVEAGG